MWHVLQHAFFNAFEFFTEYIVDIFSKILSKMYSHFSFFHEVSLRRINCCGRNRNSSVMPKLVCLCRINFLNVSQCSACHTTPRILNKEEELMSASNKTTGLFFGMFNRYVLSYPLGKVQYFHQHCRYSQWRLVKHRGDNLCDPKLELRFKLSGSNLK